MCGIFLAADQPHADTSVFTPTRVPGALGRAGARARPHPTAPDCHIGSSLSQELHTQGCLPGEGEHLLPQSLFLGVRPLAMAVNTACQEPGKRRRG